MQKLPQRILSSTSNAMFWFFLKTIFDFSSGSAEKALTAVEALEIPATNPSSQRYRAFAVGFFFLAAAFLLSAAIAFTIAPQNVVNEILGWTGIVCLHVCVVCGLRYGTLNTSS